MRCHKARRLAASINIPGAPDIQDAAARRLQRAIHDIADAVPRLLHLSNLILLGVPDKGRRQLTPIGSDKSEAQEEVGFVPPAGCAGLSKYPVIFRSATTAPCAFGSFTYPGMLKRRSARSNWNFRDSTRGFSVPEIGAPEWACGAGRFA